MTAERAATRGTWGQLRVRLVGFGSSSHGHWSIPITCRSIGDGAIPKRSDTSSSCWPNSLHGPRRNISRDIDGQILHLFLRHASRLVRTTQLPPQIMVHTSPTASMLLVALESTNRRSGGRAQANGREHVIGTTRRASLGKQRRRLARHLKPVGERQLRPVDRTLVEGRRPLPPTTCVLVSALPIVGSRQSQRRATTTTVKAKAPVFI